MRTQHTALTDKRWVPLTDDQAVKPFDQTNGLSPAEDEVEHDASNDSLTLFEKGAASNIISF